MKQYDAKKILNIALAGHSGCGKTSVAESILYLAKVSDRLGKIADGNTVLDYDAEEIKRQASIMTAVAPIEWKNTKINLIDTPGLFDFAGGVAEGMRAADTAMIVVSGKDGVNVGTEKAVEAATKAGLTKVFFVQILNSIGAFTLVYANRYGKAMIVAPLADACAPVIMCVISLILYAAVPTVPQVIGIVAAISCVLIFSRE